MVKEVAVLRVSDIDGDMGMPYSTRVQLLNVALLGLVRNPLLLSLNLLGMYLLR